MNTALRWLPFFLPTLAGAFATTTARLTTVLGVSEGAGLVTLLIGRRLDDGRERFFMAWALGLAALSSAGALVGNFWMFAVCYVILVASAATFTVSGHVFVSRRVPFERRARTIGVFETAWALALLVGVPVIALLINVFGWRAPFFALAVLSAILAVVVGIDKDDSIVLDDAAAPTGTAPLSVDAWIVIAASSAIAMTGLAMIVVVGTWLDEALGVSTGGIGLVAIAFGAAEITASASSAAVADQVGPIRATRIAIAITIVGMLVMASADASLLVAAVGLLFFFLGFEFSIVTAVSIVSEAMPTARGRVLAVNHAVSTVTRGIGIVISGLLYEAFGIRGSIAISTVTALAAIVLLTLSIRRGRGAPSLTSQR